MFTILNQQQTQNLLQSLNPRSKYPWEKIAIGESFFCPAKESSRPNPPVRLRRVGVCFRTVKASYSGQDGFLVTRVS